MRIAPLSCLALALLSACVSSSEEHDAGGGMDAAASADGGIVDSASGSPCLADTIPQLRHCPCLDGGGAFTVACSATERRCYAYNTTCADPGFTTCSDMAHEVLDLCMEFCAEYGTEEWAGACGWLSGG